MSLNTRFFTLYRELENLLTGGRYTDMLEAFQALARQDQRLMEYVDELYNFRTLRNIEAHRSDTQDYYQVTEFSIQTLTRIIELVRNPLTAQRLGVPLSKLITADVHTPIRDVIEWMHSRPYSNIPILDDRKRVIGVFSDDVLLQYLYHQHQQKLPPVINTIADLASFWPVDAHIKETYIFVSRTTSLNELLDVFQQPYRDKKRIAAVFVTQNGLSTESLLGMITPWDVLSQIKK